MLADGKRGDIDVTAAAYAQALVGRDADAVRASRRAWAPTRFTANPYLGRDTLEPFSTGAARPAPALFVLVRTSNPGAADVEDLELADGGAVWERVARARRRAGRPEATLGSPTSARSSAPPLPSTSRGCAS